MYDQEFRTQFLSFGLLIYCSWSIYVKGLPSELQFSWNI